MAGLLTRAKFAVLVPVSDELVADVDAFETACVSLFGNSARAKGGTHPILERVEKVEPVFDPDPLPAGYGRYSLVGTAIRNDAHCAYCGGPLSQSPVIDGAPFCPQLACQDQRARGKAGRF